MHKTIIGIVERGLGRAARLGFPTVNIPLAGAAVDGIYAATVTVGEATHPAVAFADPSRKLLEAHLLDFSENAYGREVTITLEKKLRDSRPFSDDAALTRAITADVARARRYFSEHGGA